MRLSAVFSAVLLLVTAEASSTPYSTFSEGQIQLRACQAVISQIGTFCPAKKGDKRSYGCLCSNKNARATMAGCFNVIDEDTHPVFKWFANFCAEYNATVTSKDMEESLEYLNKNGKNFTEVKSKKGSSKLVSFEFARNSTESDSGNSTESGNSTHSGSHSGNSTSTNSTGNSSSNSTYITFPVFVNVTAAVMYRTSYDQFYQNYNWSYYLGNGLYGYWLLVFVVAAVCNWGVVIFPQIRDVCNGRISKFVRRNITLPALAKRKKTNHQQCLHVFDFLVPSRLETLVLFGFFAVTFIFCAVRYDWTDPNTIYPIRWKAMVRYSADRTGILGTMMLPLLLLIGGRNNFLQWVTRWNFASFITYHRWIGRIIVALIVVHSINYTVLYVDRGIYSAQMKREFLIYGAVGTVAGGLILGQGMMFLRRKFYEVFLALHIALALCFMLGAWKHVEVDQYMEWIYASCAVWIFDRVVRIARMLWFGAPKAHVTLLADDCLRVVVPKPSHWPSVPGGHAWVYFCHSWYFWQSHPFTFMDSVVEKDKLVFVLKCKRGATHYITKMLAKMPGLSCEMRVIVEGPYGERCPVEKHDNVVFVAGGNGIPGIYSEVYDMAQRSKDNDKQRLKLIWVLRELATLEWVWEELRLLKDTKIEPTIYITRPELGHGNVLNEKLFSEDSSLDEKDSLTKEGKDIVHVLREYFPHINIKCGRPSMDEIVDQETDEAIKSAAFITCGHPVMVDDLRYAVVQKIDSTDKRVDFYEQLQVWA